jgi:hypothetical protein
MGNKQSKPSTSRSPMAALSRMREEVLRLRRELELEQARADAIAAQRHDDLKQIK